MAIDPRIFANTAFPSGPGLDIVGGLGQFAATLLPILNLLMQQQQFGQAEQGVVSHPFDPNRDYASEMFEARRVFFEQQLPQFLAAPPGTPPEQFGLTLQRHPVTGELNYELTPEAVLLIDQAVTGLDPRILQQAYSRLRITAGRVSPEESRRLHNQALAEAARTAIPSLERERFEQTLAEQQRQFNEQLELQRRQFEEQQRQFGEELALRQRQLESELGLRQLAQRLAEQQAQADLALRLAQTQSQLAADPFARLSFQLGLTGGQAVSDPVRVSEIFFNRLQSGQLGPVPGAAAPGLPGVFMPQGAFAPGQVAPGTVQAQPLPMAPTTGPQEMLRVRSADQQQLASQPQLTSDVITAQSAGRVMLPAPPMTGGPFAQTTSSATERLQSLIQNVTPRSIAAGFGQATPSQRTAALSLFRQAGRDIDDALQEIESFTPTRQGSTTTFFSF